MKKYLVLLLVPCIASCGFFSRKPSTVEIPVPVARKVHIDERLLVECRAPAELIENPKPTDVLIQHGIDMISYADCVRGKKALIDAVRAAFE